MQGPLYIQYIYIYTCKPDCAATEAPTLSKNLTPLGTGHMLCLVGDVGCLLLELRIGRENNLHHDIETYQMYSTWNGGRTFHVHVDIHVLMVSSHEKLPSTYYQQVTYWVDRVTTTFSDMTKTVVS